MNSLSSQDVYAFCIPKKIPIKAIIFHNSSKELFDLILHFLSIPMEPMEELMIKLHGKEWYPLTFRCIRTINENNIVDRNSVFFASETERKNFYIYSFKNFNPVKMISHYKEKPNALTIKFIQESNLKLKEQISVLSLLSLRSSK